VLGGFGRTVVGGVGVGGDEVEDELAVVVEAVDEGGGVGVLGAGLVGPAGVGVVGEFSAGAGWGVGEPAGDVAEDVGEFVGLVVGQDDVVGHRLVAVRRVSVRARCERMR
jgi:hypothetical protein